jgi:predicted metal-dependent phosphoesterase TrpH
VARAAAAGVTVLSVTDHDTVAGCAPAAVACDRAGIEFVPGIEITATREDRDVHVLGYFIDLASPPLQAFLAEQRHRRVDRVRQMIAKLGELGMPLDADEIVGPAIEDSRRSAGRPWIARAMAAAGFVDSTDEAFDRWLDRGKPAFIARHSASPDEVFERIHDAQGVASIAHPHLLGRDDWIADFVREGLDALEAYHSEHDARATARYLEMAERFGIAVTGGSDYHADQSHGAPHPGSISLPRDAYQRLVQLKPNAAGGQ